MSIVNAFKVLERMSSVKRHHSFRTITCENLLEHNGLMCFLAFYIGGKLREKEYIINMEELYEKCIVHDLEEVYTGDIPSVIKHYNDDILTLMREIGEKNIEKLEKDLELSDITSSWRESKYGETGCIVALCDCLSMVYLMWLENNLGNNFIVNIGGNIVSYLRKIESEIEYYYPNSDYLIQVISDATDIVNKIRGNDCD